MLNKLNGLPNVIALLPDCTFHDKNKDCGDTPHFAYGNWVIPFTITTYTEEADPYDDVVCQQDLFDEAYGLAYKRSSPGSKSNLKMITSVSFAKKSLPPSQIGVFLRDYYEWRKWKIHTERKSQHFYRLFLNGKTFKKPRRPYEKERLDEELKLVGEYGLSD
ncbi:hypothetical protein IFM89_012787 [Coptis chinensis]|uniref:Uncharacterized protein n=1 Tax=Coptis chinensis TaxID=261450 RepID=A0A835LM01_9MAGN|nr:hypothetical protein IFM89_012787 [Coptis chinensis]